MIRFVDLRASDIAGRRFAFWNTTTDSFVQLDVYAWDTWQEFEAEFSEEAGTRFSNSYPIERFKWLCPPWAFEPPPPEGTCYHCGSEEHEPEECALTVAAASRRAWGLESLTVADVKVPKSVTPEVETIDPTFAVAMARVRELEPLFKQEMGHRPIALDRNRVVTNPHAASLDVVEAWFLNHGVRCRLTTERASPRGYRLVFLEAELVP